MAAPRPRRTPFDASLDYEHLDLRAHPELYRSGVGEQGVLRVQPYKAQILPHWRFRTPELARESSATIWSMFLAYVRAGDFVGAHGRAELPRRAAGESEEQAQKAEAAAIFKARWDEARAHPGYQRLRAEHRRQYP